jgi:hypothetical protein
MNAFEYAVILWSLLLGLGVSDLILSANRLLRHSEGVKWDGRVVIASLLVLLELVRIWFAQWTLVDFPSALTFPAFLLLVFHIALLVFVAAAALPEETPGPIDLTAYYDRTRRYFWGLFASAQSSYFTLWLIYFFGGLESGDGTASMLDWFRMIAPLAMYAALAALRLRWLDWLGPLALIGFYIWLYWGQTIG